MQIHLNAVKILQIHNARPEFVKNITAINQSESSILIYDVIINKISLFLYYFISSCQYSYNLMLTSICMCRPYIDTNNPFDVNIFGLLVSI